MDGWTDRGMDGQTDGWMDRQMDGQIDECTSGWTDGRGVFENLKLNFIHSDGWRRVDIQMNGRMDFLALYSG